MNFEQWYYDGRRNKRRLLISTSDTVKHERYIWNACKKEVLKILKTPLKNLDLSEDNCDNRYIEMIENL